MSLSAAYSSLNQVKIALIAYAPSILGGVGILLGGWLVAKFARRLVQRGLATAKLDTALQGTRIHSIVGALGKEWTTSRLVGQAVYLVLLLFTANLLAGYWKLGGVQAALSTAVGYLPKALTALGLLAGGTYVAGTLKRTIGAVLREMRSPLAGLVETATEVGLLLIVGMIAFDMLGVNLSFITANLTVLLGAVLFVVIFLGCWAMRAPAEQLVANYYIRRLLSVGDHVETKGHRGTVLEFVPLGLVLRDATGDEIFIPARELLTGLKRRQALKPDSPLP